MVAIDLDAMVKGYLEAQLWAQLDSEKEDDGNSPNLDDNYSVDDISPEYVAAVRDELSRVVDAHRVLVQAYHDTTDSDARREWSRSDLFGHDFYLTREGHGVGFLDRGLGALGRALDAVADLAGEANPLFDPGDGKLIAEYPTLAGAYREADK